MLKKIIKLYGVGMAGMFVLIMAYAFTHKAGAQQEPDCLDKTEFPESFCPDCGESSTTFRAEYGCPPDFIDLKIYNTNGEEIYTTQDIDFSWDGKNSSGEYLGAATYFYVAQVLKGPMGITRQGYTQLVESDCLDNIKIAEEFSPNGDGLSDQFRILFRCPPDGFTIRIFGNDGSVVYESNDPDFKWNGQDPSGNTLEQGTYDYMITYSFAAKSHELKGELKLTR